MLLEDSPLASGAQLEDLSRLDILEVTPEMTAFLDRHVDDGMNENSKIRALLFAMTGEDTFELVYDDTTRTAQETFRDQHGNCLSFTNMFVAMARHMGLDASYQEVDIPPDWSSAGHAFLLSEHVNVYVNMRHGSTRIIDFNTRVVDFYIHELESTYERRVISDQRARAHYFNNIGVEQMLLRGDTLLALANFRESIRADESFASAWTNLGTLHRRDGYTAHAEAAYLKALEADPSNLVAMSNLANLYEEEGHPQFAEMYQGRVESHRMQNPYYRFHLASQAFVNGDYRGSINHLKYAIRKRKDEDRFYSLMSLNYLMSGDRAAADAWMKKAEEVAKKDSDKQRYHHKLDLLTSGDTDR